MIDSDESYEPSEQETEVHLIISKTPSMKKDYNANTLPTKVIKKRCNEKHPKKRTQWWLYPLYLLYPILIHFFRYSNRFDFYIVYIPICGLSFFLITKSVKVNQFRQFQLLLFHLTLMSIQKPFQVF